MEHPKTRGSGTTPWWTAVLIAVAGVAGCGGDQEAETAALPAEETATAAPADAASLAVEGFSTPESALFDESAGVYLVTNINGAPMEVDDNGFISRVTPEGEVESLRWIDGQGANVTLNAPKGMGLKGDTLFVSDIDAVRMFHRTTGEPLGERSIPGATFLNDIAVGGDGTVYVSDTGVRITGSGMEQAGTDAVYRFGANGRASAIARGAQLQNPNGLAVDGDQLIVVPFGGNEVYRLDANGQRTRVAQLPSGQLDGVERLADGSLLVSSWEGSAVYRVDANGQATAVVENVTSPADIGVDPTRERVLVPLFQGNQLRIEALQR